MKIIVFLALPLSLALSGCGVPDLVAHGVKAYEKSQDQRDKSAQADTVVQASNGQSDPAPEPPMIAPAPPRESVSTESLK